MRSRSGLRLATKALIIRHKSLRDPVAGCRGLGDCVWVIAPDVAAARPPSLVFALASSPRTARSRLIRPPNTLPQPPPRRLHLFGPKKLQIRRLSSRPIAAKRWSQREGWGFLFRGR